MAVPGQKMEREADSQGITAETLGREEMSRRTAKSRMRGEIEEEKRRGSIGKPGNSSLDRTVDES